MSRLTVIGAGYVGLVSAACMAQMGHEVVGLDIDSERVDRLNRGQIPIFEPGLAELIESNRDRLSFTAAPAEAHASSEFVFVCVDTPPTHSGDADLSRLWKAIEDMPVEGGDRVLVTKSTVPVGTGASVRRELTRRGFDRVSYCSNPEFLREGSAIADFMHPDRVVVGSDDPVARDRVAALYQSLGATTVKTDVASAEMIKYASNAFLATKISFINEIANVCETTDADVRTVAYGMGLDPRIGPHFLQAGIGYGGSCFPKDVAALKQLAGDSGYHFQLLSAVLEVNELQKRRVIGKLKRHLGDRLHGFRIALLGLAFKPNTDDIREASSIVLAGRLLAEGADVVAYDPVAGRNASELLPSVVYADSTEAALSGADACVLVTEWPEFVQLDWAAAKEMMRRPLVVDGRNALDDKALRSLGFTYEGVGIPSSSAR